MVHQRLDRMQKHMRSGGPLLDHAAVSRISHKIDDALPGDSLHPLRYQLAEALLALDGQEERGEPLVWPPDCPPLPPEVSRWLARLLFLAGALRSGDALPWRVMREPPTWESLAERRQREDAEPAPKPPKPAEPLPVPPLPPVPTWAPAPAPVPPAPPTTERTSAPDLIRRWQAGVNAPQAQPAPSSPVPWADPLAGRLRPD